MTQSRVRDGMGWTRIVLLISAAIAAVSISVAVSRQAPPKLISTAPSGTAEMDQLIAKLAERMKEVPSDPEGWRLLGLSYFGTGRYAEAVDAYQKAVSIKPDNAGLWSSLGEALVFANGGSVSDEALAAFEKAIAIAPDDPRARFFAASAKAERGDPRAAVADWIALLKGAPADAPWAASVREKLQSVATATGIDVAGLPPEPAPAIDKASRP